MRQTTKERIHEIQKAGWHIKDVDSEKVRVTCPRSGCGLSIALNYNSPIPDPCTDMLSFGEVVLTTFESGRDPLRARRETLGLSITEVEECAGIATDHLRKFERDNPSRIPNIVTFLEWAQTLGFEVVLRPSELPPVTVATISGNRHRLKARKARAVRENARRFDVAQQSREEPQLPE